MRVAPGLVLVVMAGMALGLQDGEAHAQKFSPYLKKSGKGPFDQYSDTLLCNAALAGEAKTPLTGAKRDELEKGITYTANFAKFLLESGNVVNPEGKVLKAGSFKVDQKQTQADWAAILANLAGSGGNPKDEIERCLAIYGHDW